MNCTQYKKNHFDDVCNALTHFSLVYWIIQRFGLQLIDINKNLPATRYINERIMIWRNDFKRLKKTKIHNYSRQVGLNQIQFHFIWDDDNDHDNDKNEERNWQIWSNIEICIPIFMEFNLFWFSLFVSMANKKQNSIITISMQKCIQVLV